MGSAEVRVSCFSPRKQPLHGNASHEVLCVVGGEGSSFLSVESKALQALAPGAIHFAMQRGHMARALARLLTVFLCPRVGDCQNDIMSL